MGKRWALWTRKTDDDGRPLETVIIDDVPDSVRVGELYRVMERKGFIKKMHSYDWIARECAPDGGPPEELVPDRTLPWPGRKEDEDQPFPLRVPYGLHLAAKAAANTEGQSLNEFIQHTIVCYLTRHHHDLLPPHAQLPTPQTPKKDGGD